MTLTIVWQSSWLLCTQSKQNKTFHLFTASGQFRSFLSGSTWKHHKSQQPPKPQKIWDGKGHPRGSPVLRMYFSVQFTLIWCALGYLFTCNNTWQLPHSHWRVFVLPPSLLLIKRLQSFQPPLFPHHHTTIKNVKSLVNSCCRLAEYRFWIECFPD